MGLFPMREISPPERKQIIKKAAQLGVLVFGVFTLATGLQAYDGFSRLTSPENVKTGAILDARDTSTHQLSKEQLETTTMQIQISIIILLYHWVILSLHGLLEENYVLRRLRMSRGKIHNRCFSPSSWFLIEIANLLTFLLYTRA